MTSPVSHARGRGYAAVALTPMLIALAPGVSHACGACVEDNVAATYDHAVVMRAAARKEVMVWCGVSGPLDLPRLKDLASHLRGVEPRSVRVSADPAALSFAVDPFMLLPQAAVDALQRKLPSATHLTLIRLLTPESANAP